MSGDHNMNQTTAGWRKRQIALNKKAENARELGLDYEPDKTVIEMARKAGFNKNELAYLGDNFLRLVELARADEREACAGLCDRFANRMMSAEECADAIRARGQA